MTIEQVAILVTLAIATISGVWAVFSLHARSDAATKAELKAEIEAVETDAKNRMAEMQREWNESITRYENRQRQDNLQLRNEILSMISDGQKQYINESHVLRKELGEVRVAVYDRNRLRAQEQT